MNITKDTFAQAVREKAIELKITPKLLLIAIGAIAEDGNVEGTTILKVFGKHICTDMKEAALKQIKKGTKARKLAGEKALQEAGPQLAAMANLKNIDGGMISANELLEDGEQLKNYHVAALNKVLSDALKIKKNMFKANSVDIVEIIKYLCPELIEQCKELAVIMKEDFNLN